MAGGKKVVCFRTHQGEMVSFMARPGGTGRSRSRGVSPDLSLLWNTRFSADPVAIVWFILIGKPPIAIEVWRSPRISPGKRFSLCTLLRNLTRSFSECPPICPQSKFFITWHCVSSINQKFFREVALRADEAVAAPRADAAVVAEAEVDLDAVDPAAGRDAKFFDFLSWLFSDCETVKYTVSLMLRRYTTKKKFASCCSK